MQENKKQRWWVPLQYGLILIVGIALGVFIKGNISIKSLVGGSKSPIEEMMQIVNERYVDSVNVDSLTIRVANYYLAGLDPHSVYIPPTELTEVNEQLTSNYRGIGIEFQQYRDSFYVSYVIKEGPAAKAGLQLGDILLKVDDSILLSGQKVEAETIRKKIKGPLGSQVKITFLRAGQIKSVQIARDNVPTSSVDASYMINDTVGYIKINRFADRTYESFMQALEPLIKKGMKSMVLDLRGNGGGLLSEAVAIADELLPGDRLIVYTEGLHSPKMSYNTKREGLFETGKLSILMDESSASASEVLAGALQDWDRATIIGRTSFGKGLVQQQFTLSNGGAFRLTTAKYYTPLGRNIQRSYAKGKMEYEHAFMNRMTEDAKGIVDATVKGKPYKTPKGHIVYGGGGIYPDKWIPGAVIHVDTNYRLLWEDNFINDFTFTWYLQHQNELNKYKDVPSYLKGMANWDVWASLLQVASPSQKQLLLKLTANKVEIKNQVLAMIARSKWYKVGYYQVVNTLDPHFTDMMP